MSQDFQKPSIAIPESDHERLAALADVLARRNADLADQLFTELERAEILPAGATRDVVRMGSTLDYRTASGEVRTATLVFPGDEDIAQGRISVLTPIGVALIGLAVGDNMEWRTPDGRTQSLTVTRIAPARATEAV
ncbi:MAG: nucleoside diphosphate kinase regulator [Hyphomonadaceae bacterium]